MRRQTNKTTNIIEEEEEGDKEDYEQDKMKMQEESAYFIPCQDAHVQDADIRTQNRTHTCMYVYAHTCVRRHAHTQNTHAYILTNTST